MDRINTFFNFKYKIEKEYLHFGKQEVTAFVVFYC